MVNYINGLFLGELSPHQTLAGAIQVFKNVWPEASSTIESVEAEILNPVSDLTWNRAATFGPRENHGIRTNYSLNLTTAAKNLNVAVAQDVHNQFYTLLGSTLGPYVKHFGIDSPMVHEEYSMLRYTDGQEYKAHYDGDTATGRCVSAILYLNSNFEGGEVEFINFGVKIKPEAGMLLLFPSNYAYTHIAHPVTFGTKYSLVTWIKDRII